jgi:hypothetical protein
MAAIDVRVSHGGSIVGGVVEVDAALIVRCSLCESEVEAVASLQSGTYACAQCLRERLDAMSVARFRLKTGGSIPWGKVTG